MILSTLELVPPFTFSHLIGSDHLLHLLEIVPYFNIWGGLVPDVHTCLQREAQRNVPAAAPRTRAHRVVYLRRSRTCTRVQEVWIELVRLLIVARYATTLRTRSGGAEFCVPREL
ncbi:hypothetical protein D3C87_1104380 [compost metagenome]